MKAVAVIFATCILGAVSAEGEDYNSRKASFIQQCKTEQNAPDEVTKIMDNKVVPENEQQSCFLECFYTKMGLVKDGKLSSEGAIAVAQRKYGNDPEKLKKAGELFTLCVEKVGTPTTEKCHYGKAIRGCFVSKDNNILNVFGSA